MTTQTKIKNLDGSIVTLRANRGMVFGAIIIVALLAFEIFNYSTTDYALTDLLGDLTFMGLRWATILTIAFCGIDFAGIARLFTPDMTKSHNENWFLFGAWLLAATMNASLTWWGVSLAILNHQTAGSSVIARDTILRIGPIFVAVLVWLIRVLIIGTFSAAGDHLFDGNTTVSQSIYRPVARPGTGATHPITQAQAARSSQAGRPAGTHSFSSQPPRYRAPAPEYTDNRDGDLDVEIIEPSYAAAPMAARPTNRPMGAPAGAPEPGSSRNAHPGRRF